jgi:hypothetical protein
LTSDCCLLCGTPYTNTLDLPVENDGLINDGLINPPMFGTN